MTPQTTRVATAVAGGVALIVGLTCVLWDKWFLEAFSGDGTEAFFLSQRLLASGPHGVEGLHPHPEFSLFTLPYAFSLMLMGPSEAAVRLPVLGTVTAIYGIGLAVVLGDRTHQPVQRWPLVVACWALYLGWATQFFAHFATYHPYVSDLAEPTGTDLFATMWFLGACAAVMWRTRGALALALVAASLSLPSGKAWALLIVGLGCGYFPARRRFLAKEGLLWLVLFGSILALVSGMSESAHTDEFSPGFLLERMENRLRALHPMEAMHAIRCVFVCTCSVALSWLAWTRFDWTERWLVVSSVLYAALVFFLMGRHLHYYTPLSILAPLPLLRWLSRSRLDGLRPPLWTLLAVVGATALHTTRGHTDVYTRSRDFSEQVLPIFRDGTLDLHLQKMGAFYLAFPPHAVRPVDALWGDNEWVIYYYARYLYRRPILAQKTQSIPPEINLVISDGALDGIEGAESFELLISHTLLEHGTVAVYVRDFEQFWQERTRPSAPIELPWALTGTRTFPLEVNRRALQEYHQSILADAAFGDTVAGRHYRQRLEAEAASNARQRSEDPRQTGATTVSPTP